MQEYRKLQERTNEDLVKEYQTTHNEDLFRALLEKNTGLLHIIVMDYRIPKYEIEDLLSESYIALIKAVDNFDPTRGVTFTTALKVFVRQHLNRLYNEVTCQKRYNGMDPASYEELVEIHKDDVRGLDCDRFSQIEVDEYLEGLEAKDRYMVTLLLMGYSLYKECKALEPVANTLAKGYKQADPRKRLELIRELDTELAEVYMVRIPVITCGVRDNSYVLQTKEIYLADPELEAFIHQFRHHLQNEARELSRKYLLMEDDPKADYRIPYREANSMLYGEDDAVAWSRFLIENC